MLCKTKRPGFRRGGFWQNCSRLEPIPQELVVDLVMELDFRRLNDGSQEARAAVGGGLFQVGVAGFHVFAKKFRGPFRVAEVLDRSVDVVRQIAFLSLAQILDLGRGSLYASLENP